MKAIDGHHLCSVNGGGPVNVQNMADNLRNRNPDHVLHIGNACELVATVSHGSVTNSEFRGLADILAHTPMDRRARNAVRRFDDTGRLCNER
jgi:hypothetical protein